MTGIIFYIFAALIVASSMVILLTKNVLYAAVSLLFTFLGIAAIYVLAHADFLAVTQIVVYVGGVLILILFGIMLTKRISINKDVVTTAHNKFTGYLIGAGMFVVLVTGILQVNFQSMTWLQGKSEIDTSTINQIGVNLVTYDILMFEVAAILLLIALMGAAMIAKKKEER